MSEREFSEGELILYRTGNGVAKIEVLYYDETFWLNQKKIVDLFGVEIPTISYHLKEVFQSGELSEGATVRKIRRVQTEGNREVSREIEIDELERIVSMYLDYAENQAARQIPMRMADWVNRLDAFLQFNEYEVLTNAGSVSAEVAKRLAEERYETFRVEQDHGFESDFEKEIKRIEKPKEGFE